MSPVLGGATVGLGVGEQHARALVATGHCTLRWVYDIDPARSSQVADALGAKIASGFDEILNDSAVQIVTLASHDEAHAEQAASALGAGKHVFVEKPLCRSREELQMLCRAWSAGGRALHLASNLVLRAAPLYRWLRDAVAGGELGEVYAFDGDYLYGRLEKITDGWRGRVEDYSVMQGGGVHLVDLMSWITGQRPSAVSAIGSRIAARDTAFRYDDYVSALYEFESGLVGRITANFGCMHRHQHVVRVFGTRATFIYDDAGPRLHASRSPSSEAERLDLSPLPASKGDLIPDFVAGIIDRRDPTRDAQREFDTMCACLAADEARRRGSAAFIEYL